MLTKLTRTDKLIIDKLTRKGNNLKCDGRGWWFNNFCFASFKDFMVFLKKIN